jgi:hypothetical protein
VIRDPRSAHLQGFCTVDRLPQVAHGLRDLSARVFEAVIAAAVVRASGRLEL